MANSGTEPGAAGMPGEAASVAPPGARARPARAARAGGSAIAGGQPIPADQQPSPPGEHATGGMSPARAGPCRRPPGTRRRWRPRTGGCRTGWRRSRALGVTGERRSKLSRATATEALAGTDACSPRARSQLATGRQGQSPARGRGGEEARHLHCPLVAPRRWHNRAIPGASPSGHLRLAWGRDGQGPLAGHARQPSPSQPARRIGAPLSRPDRAHAGVDPDRWALARLGDQAESLQALP